MHTIAREIKEFLGEYYLQLIFCLIGLGAASLIRLVVTRELNFLSITELESMLYLLSAIIQSLATILAIVITLTLVAIQLSAQFLSYRIMKVFINSWMPITTFIIYVLSIGFNVVVLSRLNLTDFNENVLLANIGCIFFITCILCLAPYALYVVRMLEPQKIVGAYIKKINKDAIVRYPEVIIWGKRLEDFVELPRMSYTEDPLQPVLDILDIAVQKRIPDTIRGIIKILRSKIMNMIESAIDDDESFKITFYICRHLKNIKGKIFEQIVHVDIALEIQEFAAELTVRNTAEVYPKSANHALKTLRDISLSFIKDPKLEDAVTFSTPWIMIPGLIEAPGDRSISRVKVKMIHLLAELEHLSDGNFLASETFHTHEKELSKTQEEKERVKYFRNKFDRRLGVLKQKPRVP